MCSKDFFEIWESSANTKESTNFHDALAMDRREDSESLFKFVPSDPMPIKKRVEWFKSQGIAIFPMYPNNGTPKVQFLESLTPENCYYPAVKGNYGVLIHDHICVLDVRGPEGVESLLKLLRLLENNLSPLLVVKTPYGGFHIYLEKPFQRKFSESNPNYPGICLLGEGRGRYLVGPGSVVDYKQYLSGWIKV